MSLEQKQKSDILLSARSKLTRVQENIAEYSKKYRAKSLKLKEKIPHLAGVNLNALDPDNEELAKTIAMINLYSERAEELDIASKSPYFVRIDIKIEGKKKQTIYIGKSAIKEEDILSWIAPVSQLRFAENFKGEFTTPDGKQVYAEVFLKEDLLITEGEISFMTYEDRNIERQVIFQKHIEERRDFMLPEIVAELDKLQDKIIRTSPEGYFLISGPAGSGKTTLALHRVAYLVLTPDFKDYFQPERILIFVADNNARQYFSKLLPELGINGVNITTFNDWGLMIINSRFRAKVSNRFKFLDTTELNYFLSKNNYTNLPSSLLINEIRKYKQQCIETIKIKEGSVTTIMPTLTENYLEKLDGIPTESYKLLKSYLTWQKQFKLLDEVDIVILLMSLENPIEPFAHVVVDEVQNWLPEQLQIVDKITSNKYKAITFVGDIRQKTKSYTIQKWEEINNDFSDLSESDRHIKLLNVYRNTKQILEHLITKGYNVELNDNLRLGDKVEIINHQATRKEIEEIISKINKDMNFPTIGILGKYEEDIEELEGIAYESENIHALTISEAQGLEFEVVIIINSSNIINQKENYKQEFGYVSAEEYAAVDKHLYYVAVTRARNKLIIFS